MTEVDAATDDQISDDNNSPSYGFSRKIVQKPK